MSTRTIEGRYAFTPPDATFTRLVWGIIAVAQRRYGVDVAAFALLGNHYHAMLRARRRGAISCFMRYLNSRLVVLTHDYNATSGRVWAKRFGSTCLLDNEAEEYWFTYILSHSVKERICQDPRLWPGPHCAQGLVSEASISGALLDRVAWCQADRPSDRGPFISPIEVVLTPISGFEAGPRERYRAWCREVIEDIVLRHADCDFIGLRVALSRGASYRPAAVKRSRCRTFDARGPSSKELRSEAYAARRAGLSALTDMTIRMIRAGHAEALARGDRLPEGYDWSPQLMSALADQPIVAPLTRPARISSDSIRGG